MYVAEPFREGAFILPNIDSPTQHELLVALFEEITLIESLMALDGAPQYEPSRLTQGISLMLRLLQFELGFQHVWSSDQAEISKKLSSLLFKLALVSSPGKPSILCFDNLDI